MKLKLVGLATGALAVSFLSAGAANGLWTSPALRHYAMDGLESALGLSHGKKGSGKLVTYAVHVGSLSADSTQAGQTVLDGARLADAPREQTEPLARPPEALATLSAEATVRRTKPAASHDRAAPHLPAPHLPAPHLPAPHWAGAEPVAPPAPPVPPAVPEPIHMATVISSLARHSGLTVSINLSEVSKAGLVSSRAQAIADRAMQASSADRQAAQFDRLAADQVRAQAQADVHSAQELLAAAEHISISINKGDYSQISVNYDGPNRCGRPSLLPGCAPLTDEDKARIRAEVRKNLAAARADLRRAVVAFQRQTRANLPEEINKARAG